MLTSKIFTILLPLMTFVMMGGLVLTVLSYMGYDRILFGEEFIGFWKLIAVFGKTGDIYVQFLGACWFLVALFEVFLFEKLLIGVCGNLRSKNYFLLYIFLTVVLYIFGYYINANKLGKKIFWLRWDMLLIASSMFAIGIIIKNINSLELEKKNFWLVGIVINCIVFAIYANTLHYTVDFAVCRFNNPMADLIMEINGIWFVYNISSLIQRHSRIVTKFFSYIGRNTMGVLAGHFGVFKMCFCVMVACGVMTVEELASVTPPVAIGDRYWPILVIVSIGCSLIVWEIAKKMPVVNFLIGERRTDYKNIEGRIGNSVVFTKVDSWITQIYENVINRKATQIIIVMSVVLSSVLCIISQYQSKYIECIEITGAGENPYVCFEEGWHDKSLTEDYRWINRKGTFSVDSRFHNQLELAIYVPDSFVEVTKAEIYINEFLLGEVNFIDERGQNLVYDISGFELGTKRYEVTIDFDGVHIPDQDSVDQRNLSGMVSYIAIR